MKDWIALPHYTRSVLEEYMAVRLIEGPNFFCHADGSPVTREYFVNPLRHLPPPLRLQISPYYPTQLPLSIPFPTSS